MPEEEKKFHRDCPNCGVDIAYKIGWAFKKAVLAGTHCIQCRNERIGEKNQGRKMSAEFCKKLSKRLKGVPKSEEHKRKLSESRNGRPLTEKEIEGHKKGAEARKGEGNGFYGKTHSKESLKKIQKTKAENNKPVTKETRAKLSKSSSERNKNPKYRRSVKEWWTDKYGPEIAEEMWKENTRKIAAAGGGFKTGELNPQFGKPAIADSGFGYNGHYKEFFFRSTSELSFLLNYVERFKFNCISSEYGEYMITYFDGVKKRHHFTDFLINGKYLVEIKPKYKWNSEEVLLKSAAAIEFCKTKNLIYKLIDAGSITTKKLFTLHLSGVIQLTAKSLERIQKRVK